MEALEIIVDILRILERLFELIIQFGDAWSMPLVALVAAILIWKFRDTIIALLDDAEKVKLGMFEWERRIRDELNLAQSDIQTIEVPHGMVQIDETLEDRVSANARGVMLEAWLGIEDTITKLVEAHDIEIERRHRRQLIPRINLLLGRDIIDADLAQRIRQLRMIRNNVAHVSEFSPNQEVALEYAELAQFVVAALEDRMPR